MLTKRIIPCLDVKDGRTVKGVNFIDLRDAGDAVVVSQDRVAGTVAEKKKLASVGAVVEMEAAQPLKGDPFYHDFPVAVIRWDTASNSFEHVGRYSEEIRALCTERLASR